ncbi:MAG: hypothetical protein HWE13_13700 [Gammaproteobacteria bacterium]|nr:hypothetical protein [Gammaproteobacteria bacterium]NVK89184.1 hypothetical protein [Gammaproteobacteria bacterium]
MKTANDLVAAAKNNITEVSIEALRASLGQNPIVIDVREPGEYANGHVPKAINIPRGVLEFQIDGHPAINNCLSEQQNLRDQPIYLYCRTGGRSALAAESLQNLGFNQVISVAGGFVEWEKAGFERVE